MQKTSYLCDNLKQGQFRGNRAPFYAKHVKILEKLQKKQIQQFRPSPQSSEKGFKAPAQSKIDLHVHNNYH